MPKANMALVRWTILTAVVALSGAVAYANEHGHATEHEHITEPAAKEHGHAEAPAEHAAEAHESEHHAEHAPVVAHSKPSLFKLLWDEFIAKVDRLRYIDEENESFRKRIAVLEVENARLGYHRVEKHEEVRSQKIKAEATHEGGVETARTIASLKTSDAKLLSQPPKFIFESALKAFDAADYETSAKAFIFLADNKENDIYQTSQTFFLAGVSLYKMGSFKLSRSYFYRARAQAATGHEASDISYAPRALAWIALCHARLGEKVAEKRTINELIQKFPKSKEARRLNRNA